MTQPQLRGHEGAGPGGGGGHPGLGGGLFLVVAEDGEEDAGGVQGAGGPPVRSGDPRGRPGEAAGAGVAGLCHGVQSSGPYMVTSLVSSSTPGVRSASRSAATRTLRAWKPSPAPVATARVARWRRAWWSTSATAQLSLRNAAARPLTTDRLSLRDEASGSRTYRRSGATTMAAGSPRDRAANARSRGRRGYRGISTISSASALSPFFASCDVCRR